jgi:hypothetical protein
VGVAMEHEGGGLLLTHAVPQELLHVLTQAIDQA